MDTRSLALGVWSFNRWPTREVPCIVDFFLKNLPFFKKRNFKLVYFGLCWVLAAVIGFSLDVESGDYSLGVVCGLLTTWLLLSQRALGLQ